MKILAYHFDQLAVFILLIITVGVCWPPQAYFSAAAQVPTSDPYSTAYNAALVAFLAVACLARAGAMGPVLRSAWPMAPLLAMAFLSAFWSSAPDVVLIRGTKIAATALFGLYLIARGDMPSLVALLVKASLVAAAASFVISVVSPDLVYATNSEYIHAWRGAFTDKNELGMVAVLGLISATYAFRRGYGSRLLAALAIPANLALLVLSNSITAELIVPIGLYLAVFGAALRRRDGVGLVSAFALVLLGLVAAAIVAGMSGDILAAVGRNATLSNRTRIWGVVIPYIARRPWLGYGLESFWLPQGVEANQIWAMLNWQTPHSHNLWLEMCLGMGLIGAGLAALLWVSAFWRAALLLLSPPPASDAIFAAVLLVAVFIANLTEFDFFRGDDIQWLVFSAAFAYLGREVVLRRRSLTEAVASDRRVPVAAAAYRAAQ